MMSVEVANAIEALAVALVDSIPAYKTPAWSSWVEEVASLIADGETSIAVDVALRDAALTRAKVPVGLLDEAERLLDPDFLNDEAMAFLRSRNREHVAA